MGILLDQFKKDLNMNRLSKSAQSRQWLYSKMQGLKANRSALLRAGGQSNVFIGKMFFFFYDPKTKATLPYYDRFPLVLPIELYDDGFLGLNLHYLDPGMRVMLLDRLAEYANNKKFDATTKLRLSYDIIANASKLDMAQPCIKRYLFGHVQSRFINIEASEWDMAAFLPSEMFVKQDKRTVWKESRNKI